MGFGFISSRDPGNAGGIRKNLPENLTSFRRELLKQANQKRKEGLLVGAWSIDGKVFIKTSPEGRPLRVIKTTWKILKVVVTSYIRELKHRRF